MREVILKKGSLDIFQNRSRQPLHEGLILLDVDLHVVVEVPPLGVLVLQPPGGPRGQGGAAGGGGRVRHLGGGVTDLQKKISGDQDFFHNSSGGLRETIYFCC